MSQMNTYEVMFILSPDLDEEGIEAGVTRFTELISNAGGEIVQLERMGRRRLAYEIRSSLRDTMCSSTSRAVARWPRSLTGS